jgi:hypothetical protein
MCENRLTAYSGFPECYVFSFFVRLGFAGNQPPLGAVSCAEQRTLIYMLCNAQNQAVRNIKQVWNFGKQNEA